MRKFNTQTDQLYFDNYISLLKAIQLAGGEGFRLLEKHEELLDTFARNSVKIEANHLISKYSAVTTGPTHQPCNDDNFVCGSYLKYDKTN